MCNYKKLTVVRQLVLPVLTRLRLVEMLNLDTDHTSNLHIFNTILKETFYTF